MKHTKKIIIIFLISLLFLSGCAYVGQICIQFLPEVFCGVITCVFGEAGLQNMLNNQEVRNFLQTHPDAEITITLVPKSNVLKNMNALSMELGTKPQIKDYIQLGLKDGSNTLTVWVDANTKELSYTSFEISDQPITPKPQPISPKEEEIKAITTPTKKTIPVVIDDDWGMKPKEEKEEPTELSDADLAQIGRLKAICERGSIQSCLVLKNRYGIDWSPVNN